MLYVGNEPFCLSNRKHVPCFYQLIHIETGVEDWENKKCCGNTSHRRMFPQLFQVLPNFHECFYNLIETQSTHFLFLLENTVTEKGKQLVNFDYQKYKFSLLAPSLRQEPMPSSVSPSSYRNTIFNQSAHVFS